jgi:hypothetical protein
MKLLDIHEELINEATGPLAAFEYILKAAGKKMSNANAALLVALKQVDPNLTKLADASDDQINRAIAKPAFKEYRKVIVDYIVATKQKDIQKILNKFDLSNPSVVRQAKAEIANKLNLKNAFANDVVTDYMKKNKPTPPGPGPGPTPPNVPDVNAFRQFLQGMKLSGHEFLVERFSWLSNTFKEKYYQNLGDINVLQQEFNDLAKNLLTKVDPKNPRIVDAELTKMSAILAKVGYRKDLQLKVIWEAWKKDMPAEFVQRLTSWENPKFQQLVTYFEKLDPSKIKTAPLATYTKLEGFITLFRKKESAFNKLQRVGFMITHLDPRTAAEINNSIKIYGFWRATGKGVGQKFIIGFVVLPFFYSILKTLLDYAVLASGISLGLGKKEDIVSSVEIEQNIGDNMSDVLATAAANFFKAYPIIGNDYRTLSAWSPLLWFLNRDRYSKMTPKELKEELKKTVPQVKSEAEKLQKEVKDSVNTQPSLKTGIENLWNKVSTDTTKVEEFNPNW